MVKFSRVELVAAATITCVITGLLLPSAIHHSLNRGILVLLLGTVGAGLILGTQSDNSVRASLTNALMPSLFIPLTYIGSLIVRYFLTLLANIDAPTTIYIPGLSGGYIPVPIFGTDFGRVALFLWIIASSAFVASYLLISLAALASQPILIGADLVYRFGDKGIARVQRMVMAVVGLVGAIIILWSAFD
jgi:hypothetical protein